MFKQDYIMNQVRNLAKLLVKLVLHKESLNVELQGELGTSDSGNLLRQLQEMVRCGEINEAENLLYESLDFADLEQYETALAFYVMINELEDTVLEEHNYSRAEIIEGISDISKRFGIPYDVSSMLAQPEERSAQEKHD